MDRKRQCRAGGLAALALLEVLEPRHHLSSSQKYAHQLAMEDVLSFTLSKELTLFPQRLGCVEGPSQVECEEQPPSVM